MAKNQVKKIPLHLLTSDTTEDLGRRFKKLGKVLLKLKPGIKEDLKKIGVRVEAEHYMVGSVISAFFYGAIFFFISYFSLTTRGEMELQSIRGISLAIGLAFFIIFFMLHLIYPKIILKKIAARENKDLLYALRELTMQVKGGVPLFDAMKNVAESDYGYVSKDFEEVVKQIESGVSESDALKNIALKSESRFLKKSIWQMINALESGASMTVALPGIIETLEEHLIREIRDYSTNMNFLMLVYMLGAAAVPSLGITFLVLLSVFSGLGITIETIELLVMFSVIIQLILIGYMSVTRPAIFEG